MSGELNERDGDGAGASPRDASETRSRYPGDDVSRRAARMKRTGGAGPSSGSEPESTNERRIRPEVHMRRESRPQPSRPKRGETSCAGPPTAAV